MNSKIDLPTIDEIQNQLSVKNQMRLQESDGNPKTKLQFKSQLKSEIEIAIEVVNRNRI
jgi:hypothetical protein